MILFLTDLHCRYRLVNAQVGHAERRLGHALEAVVVLGDFGLFEPFLGRFFRRGGERFLRPVSFVEGNHEDYDGFGVLVRRYRDVFVHLPRGTVQEIAGQRFLALGGAAYMDAHTTPRGSVIEPQDIARCLAHPPGSVDGVLSHDCPAELGLESASGFEHYGRPGFAEGRAVRLHHRPALWVFGHHNRWFEREVEGTRFRGLPQAWRGYGLLRREGSFESVRHEIAVPPSGWERFARGLRGWLGRGRDPA